MIREGDSFEAALKKFKKQCEKAGILSEILPLNFDLHRLKNLIAIDTAPARDAILRLAVLMPSAAAAASIASSLKLSNANRDRLVAAAAAQPSDLLLQPESVTRAILYRHGKDQFRALLMLSWAENATASNRHEWNALVDLAENWQAPKFPLDGRDVIAAGAEKGPEVGKTLAALENWWIEQDFNPDRAALLARLRAIVRVKGG
jgi:tRNA nucleotidyltransferase/poly(A) polymerase